MYCKKLFLGSTGKGISLKFQKTSWNKHTALVIGCDNTTGVIHEVIAVHYDSDEEQVVARTSGTKKWGIDQNAGTVSANFIVNSLILVIHTGFEEIKIIN